MTGQPFFEIDFQLGVNLEYEFLTRLKEVDEKYYPESPFLFPADTRNGCITNNMVYQFFRRICKKLEIPISRNCIRGTHAFRRTAITEVINKSNGNVVLTAQMFGNSPETIRKHYYVGEDIERKREILNMRSHASIYLRGLPSTASRSARYAHRKTAKNPLVLSHSPER